MPKLIEVPGQGTVEFPDSMTDEQIVAAIRGFSAPKAAAPEKPAEPKTFGRIVDDVVRSIASGATFGFADELAAAATAATGLGAQKPGATSYEAALAAERERNKEISPYVSIPGEIAGGVATGTALGRAGLTLLRPQMPLPASSMIARGAGEGAAYGALSGAGAGENLEERLVGAGLGAAVGAPLGAVGSAIAARATKPPAPPTTEELRAQGNAAYTAARNAGLQVKPEFVTDISKALKEVTDEFGYNPRLQPRIGVALDEVEDIVGRSASADKVKGISGKSASIDEVEGIAAKPISLDDLENVRKTIRRAGSSADPSERELSRQLIERFDEAIGQIGPSSITAGDEKAAIAALTSARSIWSKNAKARTVENLIQRAEDGASTYTSAGFENAIRAEFRNFARNEKKMRGFNQQEQEAIRAVGQGNFTDNALRFLGKFAPRGPVGTGVAGGIGAVLGGGPGAVATLGVGEAARQAATSATLARAQRAAEMMRAGAPLQRRPLTAQEMLAARASAVAGGAAFPGGLLREEEPPLR